MHRIIHHLLALALLGSIASAQTTPKPPVTLPPGVPRPSSAPDVPIPPASTPKPKPKRTPESALTPEIKDKNRHDGFLERIKKGEVGLLFLGDSITDAWPGRGKESWAKFAPYHPADFGISGDRTEHLLWRITNGELDGIDPKVTVIMIGTNNIGHFSDEKPEWAAAGVKKIVDTVRAKLPKTRILLLGVFPRSDKGSTARKAVAEINEIISKLDDGKQVRYLDVGPKFLDANGDFLPGVMPDKLHPSTAGYDIWYDAMNPLLSELLK
jgi:lysophospholipase L1-like esterase